MFKKEEYINLIIDGNITGAESYKVNNAPKTLYKYMSFSNHNEFTNLTELDKKKLKGIENNTIWMPLYKDLNDPFEMKALYYEKSILEEKGWDIESVEKIFKDIKGTTTITSFTASSYNNMPMWAHYSNNHYGICIEYEVINSTWLYPISYETNRVCINSILTNTINESISYFYTQNEDEKIAKEEYINRNIYNIYFRGYDKK